MSKLFQLKAWLTIKEAADHLSNVLGEEVHDKDIYRLALDGHLVLSVDFVNQAIVRFGEIVGPDETLWVEFPRAWADKFHPGKGETVRVMTSLSIGSDKFINLEKVVSHISGVWDLMMLGGERLDIEHIYQSLIGGPEVTLTSIDGAFVQAGDQVAQLQESFNDNEFQEGSDAHGKSLEQQITEKQIPHKEAEKMREKFREDRNKYMEKRRSRDSQDDYYPAGGLPDDSVLVVRTREIINFLQSLEDREQGIEKPIQTKEKNSLLVTIAALCKEVGIDPNEKGVASAIELMTQKTGAPLTDDTIRKILKQLDDAVTARSK